MIETMRSLKVDYSLKPSMDTKATMRDENGKDMSSVSYTDAVLQRICHATWVDEDGAVEMVMHPTLNGTLNVPLAAIINVEEEVERLSKRTRRLQRGIKRGEGILSNSDLVNKAPEVGINAEREKLEGYRSQYAIAGKQLERAKKKTQFFYRRASAYYDS